MNILCLQFFFFVVVLGHTGQTLKIAWCEYHVSIITINLCCCFFCFGHQGKAFKAEGQLREVWEQAQGQGQGLDGQVEGPAGQGQRDAPPLGGEKQGVYRKLCRDVWSRWPAGKSLFWCESCRQLHEITHRLTPRQRHLLITSQCFGT